MPDDKFLWGNGDIKAEKSQCIDCKNNLNYQSCIEFMVKPLRYRYNEDACPRRIPEE